MSTVFVALGSGLLEVIAFGLERRQVQLGVDHLLSRAHILASGRNAYLVRPTLAGQHRVFVCWQGNGAPSRVDVRFLNFTPTFSEVEQQGPEVAAVIRQNSDDLFEMSEVLEVSQAPDGQSLVYGVFAIDRRALLTGRHDTAVIKQDYVVNDRSAVPPEITYYTGHRAPGPHRSIEQFCERFGADNYGCTNTTGGWKSSEHLLSLDDWDRRPSDPRLRAAIDVAALRVRQQPQ
jgi:hypothetical protein